MKKTKNVTKYIRINEEDWNQAAAICDELGTTPSAVVGQMIKQIIIQKRIPFQITLHKLKGDENVGGLKERQSDIPEDPLQGLYESLGMDSEEELINSLESEQESTPEDTSLPVRNGSMNLLPLGGLFGD